MIILNSKIAIPQDLINECNKFAQNVFDSNRDAYARRGQTNKYTIIRQITEGKVAEGLNYSEFLPILPNLMPPDYEKHDKKDKSWDPDLKDKVLPIRIGVKAQNYESAQYYHESWVYQYNDGKNYDCDTGIFGKDIDQNHYVCMWLLNMPKRVAQLRACVKVQWLRDNNMFQPMTLAKFSSTNNKLAVYYDHPTYKSLSHFPTEELWQL